MVQALWGQVSGFFDGFKIVLHFVKVFFMKHTFPATLTLVTASLLSMGNAWAGRPLTIDDAGVNDKGAGHVEAWIAREPGKINTLNLAPAYSLFENVELGALLSRDDTNNNNLSAIQAKWRITPSQEKGCNFAAILGAAHVSHNGGNGSFLTGVASCNGTAAGNVHLNLGLVKANNSSAKARWGVALEREMGGLTPHVELFGVEGDKPTLQIGARKQLTKALQLDGTVGRSDGNTVYSLGVKFQF
jgi:hypothetical protein